MPNIIKASTAEVNSEKLGTILGAELMNKLGFKFIESSSITDSKKYILLTGGSEEEDKDFFSGDVINSNHFINMLSTAFNLHKPIVLSPDDFWLLICQGFANYVKNNKKYFKGKFTKPKNKIKVSVRRDDFIKGLNNDWENVFPEFMTQINDKIKTDLVSKINLEFSTTTSTESVAYSISLMDSLSSFIDYEVNSLCGIPQIEILGTIEDYEKIKINLNELSKYNLGWWINKLIPVIDNIIKTLKGEVDDKFWQSIFKVENNSGGSDITGWITHFFPYIKESKFKKTLFSYKIKISEIKNPILTGDKSTPIKLGNFPNGISKVDFKWNCIDSAYDMKFISGFIGITEDIHSNQLKSEINWIIAEQQ